MRKAVFVFVFVLLAVPVLGVRRLPKLGNQLLGDEPTTDVLAPTVAEAAPLPSPSVEVDYDPFPTIHSGFLPLNPDPASNYNTKPLILPDYDEYLPTPSPGQQPSASTSPFGPEPTIGPHTVDWHWEVDELPSPSESERAPSPAWPVDVEFSHLPWEYYSRSLSPSDSPSISRTPDPSFSSTRSPSPSRSTSPTVTPTPSVTRTPSTTRSPSTTPSLTSSETPSQHPSKSPKPSHSPRPSPSLTPSKGPSATPYPNFEATPETFVPHSEEGVYQDEEDRADWSYDNSGGNGPAKWGRLDRSFKDCAAPNQSPVDLSQFAIASSSVPMLSLSYQVGYLLIRNTGNYVRVVNHRGNSARLGNSRYNLMYVGVHTPSEHTINGESFPAELQFIHKHETDDRSFLAISVLLDAGDGQIDHPLVSQILSDCPKNVGEGFTEVVFDLSSAIPLDVTSLRAGRQISYPYFTYDGTLTTPPCTGGVKWLVWSKPDHISYAQIDKLVRFAPNSNRPIQPLGSRKVMYKNLFL